MESHIVDKPVIKDHEEPVILIYTKEVTRALVIVFLFVIIGLSEIGMDKSEVINASTTLFIRFLYVAIGIFIVFKYLLKRDEGYGVLATDHGLYFLISKKSKKYAKSYFFIDWRDISCIRYRHDSLLFVETKIPAARKMRLSYLPEDYQTISLQMGYFDTSFGSMVLISVSYSNVNKWLDLEKKYPVKIFDA